MDVEDLHPSWGAFQFCVFFFVWVRVYRMGQSQMYRVQKVSYYRLDRVRSPCSLGGPPTFYR